MSKVKAGPEIHTWRHVPWY